MDVRNNSESNLDLDFEPTFTSELGILFTKESATKKPGEASRSKSRRFCPKLKIYREFTLATLSALSQKKKQTAAGGEGLTQLCALDGFSSTGLAAIQWKRHLKEDVHITAAEHEGLGLLEQNIKQNSLQCLPLELDPSRVPGDPKKPQTSHEIFSCRADARSVMAMESFHFIYLSPNKNNSICLEPAFHSLTSGGVLCLVVPDVCVFARSPHVVWRSFSAQVIRTEYLKEMAARVVLAEAARSAAKHSKGISVLYVVSHEDFVLIAVRVQRGQKAADSSVNSVSQLLHCRFCEERVFLPNQLAPQANVGKTAVLLGPMWKERIFDTEFLECVKEEGKKLQLSAKFFETLSLLLTESWCCSSMEIVAEPMPSAKNLLAAKNGNSEIDIETSQHRALPKDEHTFHSAAVVKDETSCPSAELEELNSVATGKRKLDPTDVIPSAKRQKQECMAGVQPANVPFYYNIKKFKKTISHKLNKLVTILHSNGHHASRTHFDSCAIRTSATVPQFLTILD